MCRAFSSIQFLMEQNKISQTNLRSLITKKVKEQTNHFPGLGLTFLFLLMLLELAKILELEALESFKLSFELFLFSSPSMSSTSYLFFLPGKESSGTISPAVCFHSLQIATVSIMKQMTSRSKMMPIAKRSMQQLASHEDPETYKLQRKQKMTSPVRQKTLPTISYLKLYLIAQKAAQATRRKAAQQQKDVVPQLVARAARRAKRAALAQLANSSHLMKGSSVSSSKNLQRITWPIGKTTSTAKTTMAGIEIQPPAELIKFESERQIKGRQNHLKRPLNILQTLGKVTPFSLTFSGIVMSLIINRQPTKMTRKERAKALTQTQVPIGQQKPVSVSVGSTMRLLPIQSLLENGIETEALARAKIQPHCMQSRALAWAFLTKGSKNASATPTAEKMMPIMSKMSLEIVRPIFIIQLGDSCI